MEKVIVAFENPNVRESVCEMLESGGVARSVPCQSASEVRRLVNMQGIHVVVCGFKFPDAPGETLFYDLPETCAMVMLARKNRLELCETEEIFQLPFPANPGDLLATVEILLQLARRRRGHRPVELHDNEDRELLVAKAKVVLMDRHGMTEAQADRCLEREHDNYGTEPAEMARMVLGNSI